MRKIELKYGRGTVLVDDEDYGRLIQHDWRWLGRGYASTKIKGVTTLMHRLLLGVVGRHNQVDHINGNKLDNRRSNLRRCTNAENHWNMAQPNRSKTRPYKGVFLAKQISPTKNPWRAQIRQFGKTFLLGKFRTPEAAAEAYNRAAIERFGEFACLNIVTADVKAVA